MSLIPYMLTRLAAAPAPAVATGRYDPGAGHRPVAAIIAVGAPAALLVAVALSPFDMPPILEPGGTIVVQLPWTPPPPPPPKPTADPQTPPRNPTTAPDAPLPPISRNPVDPVANQDPIPIPDPGLGKVETPTIIKSIPVTPPLIEAKLDPRFAGSFQPEYPPFEQRNEIEGTARVRVLVGTDGRVKAVEDVGASSAGFFTETKRRALAKWRFKPATRGGEAEESWVIMTVRFRLER
jgi:periplasmic protein TonB